jgi:PAS domain S-box-containing protein
MQTPLEDALIVLDTVPEAYIRLDCELRFTFVNRAAQPLLGRPRSELLGKKLRVVYPSTTGTLLEECCRRAQTSRTPVTLEQYLEAWRGWYAITAIPDANDGIVVQFSDITAGKVMEDALRKSEEKFSKAFHSSPVSMCIVDVEKNSSFLEVNEAFEQITGYRRDETIGHTTTELGLYDDFHDLEESRRRLLADGGYRNLEIRFRRKNGDVIVGLVSAQQIEINGTLCAISVAADVTEQRRAEQALRDSEELYCQLFNLESDAILLVDRESGRLLAANVAATVLYGYSRETLLSMNRTDLSAEPDETLRATREMQAFIPLRWHRKKDGTIFPVEIAGRYFDLKGRCLFVSAIRDITDRRQIEEALKKSEEKFSKAFRANPAAVTITDLTSKSYLEINEAFERMTGYCRDEVIGRPRNELVLWDDPQDWDQAYAQLAKEGRLRNFEFRFHKKDGNWGAGLLSAELIDIDGKQCAITAAVDITDRIQLESRLRQAQKLESVGRLAGGVAHDFNNLLTLINGYSDFLLATLHTDDSLWLQVNEIKKAGEHAAGLTRQLLTFSRQQIIEPKPLDVNNIVKDAERMLQRLIGEDVELVTTLDPLLGQVMADPGQINQVIMNLVVNSRDAMPDGGKLEICTKSVDLDENTVAEHPDAVPGSYVLMTVTDNGIGIDESTLQSVFEPFFTTKGHGKGTGLGLSTVYGIVKQSGGWIEVRSELRQGTSFRIYLPRVEARQATDSAVAAASKALQGSETVLLVEDHDEVRKLTRTILEAYGYYVLEAANGSEALVVEKGHASEIDLLLTDVILPGMNGKSLSERLQVLRPKLKVLFTSGYPAEVIARRGVLERDVAYLPKPFSPEALASKVREVLSDADASPQKEGSSA